MSEALAVGAVVIQPTWRTFEETVAGLVERLVAVGRLSAAVAAAAVRRVCEREAIASTAMVDIGIGIPHARFEGVNGIVAAIAVSPTAVYQFADRVPISIVALVLSPPLLTGDHLNFLSSLSMLLQSTRVRDTLRAAATPEEVWRLVEDQENARRARQS